MLGLMQGTQDLKELNVPKWPFFLGDAIWPGAHDVAIASGALAAGLCYLVTLRYAHHRAEWNYRAFRLAAAATFAWLLAGIAAGLLTGGYHGIFGPAASPAYCATIRTGIAAASALLLGWVGAHWERLELAQLIYPAMLVGAWRLVMEDLHQERKAALVLSLLLYGTALMVLPRFKNSAKRVVPV